MGTRDALHDKEGSRPIRPFVEQADDARQPQQAKRRDFLPDTGPIGAPVVEELQRDLVAEQQILCGPDLTMA
jgi:hypothetical protein